MADRFSFDEFAKALPRPAVEVLKEEGFDDLTVLLNVDARDIEGLQIKRGHVVSVREAVKRLQETHRQGPFFTTVAREPRQDTNTVVAEQPASKQPLSLVTADTPPSKHAEMDEIRVVLLGKTGSGKSSFGNSLLGRSAFHPARGMSSGTQKCEWAEGTMNGVKLSITDTPGLCDTHRKEEDVLLEVGKSIAVACPGPHVVIMVVPCNRRFTKEEYDVVKTLLALFGDGVRRHLCFVFTGGDDLGVPMDEMQQALKRQIKVASRELKEVLHDAYNRFCVVDNTGSFEERQKNVHIALQMILNLKKENNDEYFTNDMVDAYNRKVQSAILRRQREGHLSTEEAVKETRKAIVEEKEEPGFFKTIVNFSKDYVLPVVSRVAADVAVGAVAKRCSLM